MNCFEIIGYAIIQLPELVLSLHGVIMKRYYKKSFPKMNSSNDGTHVKGTRSNEHKIVNKSVKRNSMSKTNMMCPMNASSFNREKIAEDRLSDVLERMERIESKLAI